jgi:hypothetical protein
MVMLYHNGKNKKTDNMLSEKVKAIFNDNYQGDYKERLERKVCYYLVAELVESCKKMDGYQNIPEKLITEIAK